MWQSLHVWDQNKSEFHSMRNNHLWRMLASSQFRLLFSSCVLSKNTVIKIGRTVILYVVVWAWNLVDHIKWRMWAESVGEQGAKDSFWNQEGGSNTRLEDIAREVSLVCTLPSILKKVISRLVRWVRLIAGDGGKRNTVLMGKF